MGLALWLVPSSPSDASSLQSLITSLSTSNSTPSFAPHVTLLTGLSASTPTPALLSTLKDAIIEWHDAGAGAGEVELHLRKLGSKAKEGNYFQYVYAEVKPAPALLLLRTAVRDFLIPDLAGEEDDYFPHLSLVYGKDEGERSAENIMNELGKKEVRTSAEGCRVVGLGGFRATEVVLIQAEGKPEEWKELGRVPL